MKTYIVEDGVKLAQIEHLNGYVNEIHFMNCQEHLKSEKAVGMSDCYGPSFTYTGAGTVKVLGHNHGNELSAFQVKILMEFLLSHHIVHTRKFADFELVEE
jgi:hypothetical protein